MTDVPLREHIEARLCAHEAKTDIKLSAMRDIIEGKAAARAAWYGIGSSILVGVTVGLILMAVK